MTDETAIARTTALPSPSAIVGWMPWTDRSVGYVSTRRGEGAGEHRLAAELVGLGVYAARAGGNCPYDLESDLGTIEVKAPDTAGRIVTSVAGHEALAPFVTDCVRMLTMFEGALDGSDEEFTALFRACQARLQRGNFTFDTLRFVLDVVEMMSAAPGPWQACRHEWIRDPASFIIDSAVFPSRCIEADHIALVCEEGYALLTLFDADNLLRFQGDAWGGRPKFFCEQATKTNRSEIIRKSSIEKSDRIAAIQRLRQETKRIRQDRQNRRG